MKDGFDRFDSRNKAKVEMLRIMYFDSKKAEYKFYKPFKRFQQIFPAEAKVITALKSRRYEDFPILLLALYAKNEKGDLTAGEKREFAASMREIVRQWKEK